MRLGARGFLVRMHLGLMIFLLGLVAPEQADLRIGAFLDKVSINIFCAVVLTVVTSCWIKMSGQTGMGFSNRILHYAWNCIHANFLNVLHRWHSCAGLESCTQCETR